MCFFYWIEDSEENNMRDRSKRSNNLFMWIEVCCVTCWQVHLLLSSLRSAYEITVHAVCYKTAKKTNNANMYKHLKKQLFSHENLYRKYIQCSSMFHAWQNCLISISLTLKDYKTTATAIRFVPSVASLHAKNVMLSHLIHQTKEIKAF